MGGETESWAASWADRLQSAADRALGPRPEKTGPALRVLVTGSRHWRDRGAVRRALLEVMDELDPDDVRPTTLVHGDASGADNFAALVAGYLGFTVEAHPADWSRGRRAGPERNQRMVDAGADVVLAFPLPGSVGTWDCVDKAEKAGIRVINKGVPREGTA